MADPEGRKAAKDEVNNGKDLENHLRGLGYIRENRANGSHRKWTHPARNDVTLVEPVKDMKGGTISGILDKVYGLDGMGQNIVNK